MGTDCPIAGALRYWVTRKPEAACVVCEDSVLSWRQAYDRACRLGQGLIGTGVRRQDRVMYLGKNRSEFFEILAGTSMAGAVTAAVNWRLVPREMLYIINHSRARVLFVEADFLGHVEAIRAELEFVSTLVVIAGPARRGGSSPAAGVLDYEPWLAEQVARDPRVAVARDATVFQMYTSGTTGLPKGAMFSNAAVQATDSMAAVIGVDESSVVLVAMPVFHAAGSSLGILALRQGATMVIAREVVPDRLLELIAEHRVTMSTLVPSVLKMLLERPTIDSTDLSSLDTIAYAASPISPGLLAASLARFRCKFVQIYGMTETNGVTALYPEDHLDPAHPERMRSGGRALTGVTLRIVDPLTGREAGEGEFGEVWIKAPTNMQGYWDSAQETSAALTADGYVRSGDGGFVSAGYLYLKDRIKDMIVSGAENIYPIEVENVLITHPDINDVAVIGVPSQKWGETVRAVVVRERPDAELTADEVIAYAKANLAGFKCPTSVEFIDQLPRNPSGKVLKRVLRRNALSPEIVIEA
jgi:long-chain acyl-CoA synthetase